MRPRSLIASWRRSPIRSGLLVGLLGVLVIGGWGAWLAGASSGPSYPAALGHSPSAHAPEVLLRLPGPRHAEPASSPAAFAIDPNGTYSSEPAPVGITDFGVTPGGAGYAYSTPVIQASATLTSLFDSSTSAGNSLTLQLNVEDVISGGGHTYVYWIQDVAFFNSRLSVIDWEDNVWNLSAGAGTALPSNSLAGNGSTFSGIYYAAGAQGYPGSNVTLVEPTTITARVVASNASGTPHVGFEYNDGFGWVTYDNVTFPFLQSAVNHGFHVDGTQYLPGSGGYFDAEWVMGGPGSGLSQTTVRADVNLTLSYWNGHNLQAARAAWGHGANTAETVSNVREGLATDAATGVVGIHAVNGSGSVGPLYGASQTSTLEIAVGAFPTGTLTLNRLQVPYIGGMANLTLPAGTYAIDLLENGSVVGATNVTLAAGEFRLLHLTPFAYYPLTFVSIGLPAGTPWSVTVGTSPLSSASDQVATAVRNGSYGYVVAGVPGYFLALYTGTASVLGGSTSVNLFWSQTTYVVSFVGENFVSGTSWDVSVAGRVLTGTGDTLSVVLPNGTFPFTVNVPRSIAVTPSADNVTLNGSGTTAFIGFSVAPGQLRISVAPAGATVTVDGEVVNGSGGGFAVSVSPGTRTIHVTAPGYSPTSLAVNVSAGEVKSVTIHLLVAPVAPGGPPGSPISPTFGGLPIWAWALGAAIAAAAISLGMVLAFRPPPPRQRTIPP